MIIQNLFIYPIKSCRGISLTETEVTPKGFLWDRELMIVDSQGKFITQRVVPQLATVEVKINDNCLELSAPDQQVFSFEPTTNGPEMPVEIWRDHTIAIDQGQEVASWLQKALNFPDCRLVRQSPEHIRPVNPNYAKSNDKPVSFADGYPVLIAATASLAELNRRLVATYQDETAAIPMSRFRPNAVIETTSAFVEGNWQKIKIGAVELALVKPCDRCIVTTTDQTTGTRNQLGEPLKTLATFRKFPGGLMFGENAMPLNSGVIKIGDTLTAEDNSLEGEVMEVRNC